MEIVCICGRFVTRARYTTNLPEKYTQPRRSLTAVNLLQSILIASVLNIAWRHFWGFSVALMLLLLAISGANYRRDIFRQRLRSVEPCHSRCLITPCSVYPLCILILVLVKTWCFDWAPISAICLFVWYHRIDTCILEMLMNGHCNGNKALLNLFKCWPLAQFRSHFARSSSCGTRSSRCVTGPPQAGKKSRSKVGKGRQIKI